MAFSAMDKKKDDGFASSGEDSLLWLFFPQKDPIQFEGISLLTRFPQSSPKP